MPENGFPFAPGSVIAAHHQSGLPSAAFLPARGQSVTDIIVKRSGPFYDDIEISSMPNRPRLYDALLREHLSCHRQMALVSGPRQVGKTTACHAVGEQYLNWDNLDDRRRLLAGPAAIGRTVGIERLRAKPPVVVLDELHKYSKWKAAIVVQNTDIVPMSHAAGGKRYVILPYGQTNTLIVEERELKFKR